MKELMYRRNFTLCIGVILHFWKIGKKAMYRRNFTLLRKVIKESVKNRLYRKNEKCKKSPIQSVKNRLNEYMKYIS